MKYVSAVFVLALAGIAGCAESNTNQAPQSAANTTTEPVTGDPAATSTTTTYPTTGSQTPGSTTGSTASGTAHTDGSMGHTGHNEGRSANAGAARTDAPRADNAGTATTATTPAPAPVTPPPATTPAPGPAPVADATNTGKNERDRGNSTLTPMDQGGSEADRKVTQKVRQAIVADGSLSFTAKNVKIITIDGNVTLRGPVKSTQERTNIEQKAKTTPGVKAVDNQLEIKG